MSSGFDFKRVGFTKVSLNIGPGIVGKHSRNQFFGLSDLPERSNPRCMMLRSCSRTNYFHAQDCSRVCIEVLAMRELALKSKGFVVACTQVPTQRGKTCRQKVLCLHSHRSLHLTDSSTEESKAALHPHHSQFTESCNLIEFLAQVFSEAL